LRPARVLLKRLEEFNVCQNETIQRPLLHAQAQCARGTEGIRPKSALACARAEESPSLQYNGVAKLNGGFADSAFADNKQRPIHRWVPWIAGFASEFVRDAFSRYCQPERQSVLWCWIRFCGVGTTLIEALRCGHDAIGFEINPYAALAARAKCEAAAIVPSQLDCYILKFQKTCKVLWQRPTRLLVRSISARAFRSSVPAPGQRS